MRGPCRAGWSGRFRPSGTAPARTAAAGTTIAIDEVERDGVPKLLQLARPFENHPLDTARHAEPFAAKRDHVRRKAQAAQPVDHQRQGKTEDEFNADGGAFVTLVALTGTLRGMQAGRSAARVGEAATGAVVTGIVAIIAACGVYQYVFFLFGW